MKLLAAAGMALALLVGVDAQAQSDRAFEVSNGLQIAISKRPSVPGPAIPEPTGALLFAAGLLAASAYGRSRRDAR